MKKALIIFLLLVGVRAAHAASCNLAAAAGISCLSVQTGTINSSGGTFTFSLNPTAGNTLVVVTNSTSAATTTPTDSQANRYFAAVSNVQQSSASVYVSVYYTYAIIGGSNTVTLGSVGSAATKIQWQAFQFAGLINIGNPFDQQVSAAATSTTPASGATATTIYPVELALGVLSSSDGSTAQTAGSGWTLEQSVTGSNLVTEDRILNPTATPNATWGASLAGGSTWASATVTMWAPFTAATNGDWFAPATWGLSGGPVAGSNYPVMTGSGLIGNTVLIPAGITVTCIAENCSAGSSPFALPTLTPSGSGGTLAAGTYWWVVGVYGSGGLINMSQQATATVSGTTSSVGVAWATIAGQTSAVVCRGTYLVNNICYTVAGRGTTYTDTGAAATATPISSTPIAINMTGTGLHLESAAALVYGGDVQNANGTITADAGTFLYPDESWSATPTTSQYWLENGLANSNTAAFAINGTATWTIGVTGIPSVLSGTPVTWNGDSSASPLADPGICTTGSCLGGGVGQGTSTLWSDQNSGTVTGLLFEHMRGVSIFGTTNCSWIWATSAHSASISNSYFYDDYPLNLGFSSNGVGSWTFDKSVIAASANIIAGAFGQFNYQKTVPNSGSGVLTITNSVFDGQWREGLPEVATGAVIRNLMFYAGQGGTAAGLYGGPTQTDASVHDQILIYINGASNFVITLPLAMKNSVVWREGVTGSVNAVASSGFASGTPAGTYSVDHNYFGGFGQSTSTSLARALGATSPSSTGAVASSWTNNIFGCGTGGKSSIDLVWISSANTNLTYSYANNTSCNAHTTLASDAFSAGDVSLNHNSITVGQITSIYSNLFFREDATGPIAEVCNTSGLTGAGAAITNLGYNAVVNAANTNTPICANAAAWIGTGPTGDVFITSRGPNLVEPTRSLPLFDSEYLIPAGYLSLANYGGSPGCGTGTLGNWTNGATYTAGQYMCDQQATVYGNKTTYWHCIVGHTAGSTNRPATGLIGSYGGTNSYWEEAWMPWMRAAILVGTQYYDGAINANGVYAAGLLNAWLRAGYVSLEPSLWSGCLSGAECGYSVPMVNHITPQPSQN